jgi:hypothetical protein
MWLAGRVGEVRTTKAGRVIGEAAVAVETTVIVLKCRYRAEEDATVALYIRMVANA